MDFRILIRLSILLHLRGHHSGGAEAQAEAPRSVIDEDFCFMAQKRAWEKCSMTICTLTGVSPPPLRPPKCDNPRTGTTSLSYKRRGGSGGQALSPPFSTRALYFIGKKKRNSRELAGLLVYRPRCNQFPRHPVIGHKYACRTVECLDGGCQNIFRDIQAF